MSDVTNTAPYKKISPKYMLLLLIFVLALAFIYYSIALVFNPDPMSLFDYVVFTCVLAIIMTGAYQLFFWVQNNNYFFKTRCLATKLDELIPFWPIWVWPYTFLYYIMIGMVVIEIHSIQEGIYIVFGGLLLLLVQCFCFLLIPCRVPKHFKDYEVKGLSTRYLHFIQKVDNGRNCFPSMHNSVATSVGLLLMSSIGIWSYVFIATIAIATLFVKQHTIADGMSGILLGWSIYNFLGI